MRTMNLNFKKLLFAAFFVFTSGLFAQERIFSEYQNSFNLSIPPEIQEYQFNELDLSNNLYKLSLFNNINSDSSAVWMKTRLMIGAFSGQSFNSESISSNMLSPVYNCYLESQKLALLKSILGAVQMGAVGYLAYKHLRKYGFLKKK
jgi:hypothetical protein